jgi:hypothetical protein
MNKSNREIKIGILISYITMIIGIISQFIVTPILLRIIGNNEYGLYTLVLSVVNYLNLFNFGLGHAYVRFFYKLLKEGNKNKISSLNTTFFLIFFIGGILTTLICLLIYINPEIILKTESDIQVLLKVKKLIFIMSILVFTTFLNIVFNCYLTAKERFIYQNILNLMRAILTTILTIIVVFVGYGINGIAISNVIVGIIILILSIFYCVKKINMKFSAKILKLRVLKEIGTFSSFIFLQMIMDQILWNIDLLLLSKYTNLEEVARYSIAGQFNAYYMLIAANISKVFITKINKIIFSNEIKEKNRELEKLMIKIGRTQLYILGFVFISFILLGRQFINIWLGKNYTKTYYVSIILMGAVTLPAVQVIGQEIERAKNKQKFMCVVGILLAIANIFVSIPLIKIYGGIGAAIGTGIVLVVGFLIIRNIFYKYFLNLNVLKVLKNIYKIIPVLIIFYFIGELVLKFFVIDKIIEFIMVGSLLTIIYLILVWFFSFNKDEKQLFGNILKNFRRG